MRVCIEICLLPGIRKGKYKKKKCKVCPFLKNGEFKFADTRQIGKH